MVPQSSVNYLSVYVAESRGLFHQEGFEHETLVLAGPVAAAALLAAVSTLPAAAERHARSGGWRAGERDFFSDRQVTFYLVTDGSVTKAAESERQEVGVGGVGSSQDRLDHNLYRTGGFRASDITRIAMGADARRRILAIKSGTINATMLDPGTVIYAEKEGLRTLAFLGDLFPYPFQAFAATDRKLRDNPEQVKRWLRAMVNSVAVHSRQSGGCGRDRVEKDCASATLPNPALIDGIKRYNRALSKRNPGCAQCRKGRTNVIEYEIKLPLKIDGELAQDKVLNLKLIQQVKAELESKKVSR